MLSAPPVSQSYARQYGQTGQASTITLAVAAWRTTGLPDEGIVTEIGSGKIMSQSTVYPANIVTLARKYDRLASWWMVF